MSELISPCLRLSAVHFSLGGVVVTAEQLEDAGETVGGLTGGGKGWPWCFGEHGAVKAERRPHDEAWGSETVPCGERVVTGLADYSGGSERNLGSSLDGKSCSRDILASGAN